MNLEDPNPHQSLRADDESSRRESFKCCCCCRRQALRPSESAQSMTSFYSTEDGEILGDARSSSLIEFPLRAVGTVLGVVSRGTGMLLNVVTLPARVFIRKVRRRTSSSSGSRSRRSNCCDSARLQDESLNANATRIMPLGYSVMRGSERKEVDSYNLTDPKDLQHWLRWEGEVPEGCVQIDKLHFRVVGTDAVGLRRLDATVKRHFPKTFRSENMTGDFPVGDHDFEFPEVKVPAGMTVRGEYTTTQHFVDATGREVCPRRELRYRIVKAHK